MIRKNFFTQLSPSWFVKSCYCENCYNSPETKKLPLQGINPAGGFQRAAHWHDTELNEGDEYKAIEKVAVKSEKAAVKAADKEEKASRKPVVKRQARKMNIVFQSQSGSGVTSEQIALKVPKEAVDVYVKLEENKIYWVGKNGEMGSVDIW